MVLQTPFDEIAYHYGSFPAHPQFSGCPDPAYKQVGTSDLSH